MKSFKLSQNWKKSIDFGHKLDQNHFIDQKLAKLSLETPKKRPIFPKTRLFFKIFGAFGAESLEFYVPKKPFFWS